MKRSIDIHDITVIAPNFKRRLSGVTSTIVALLPLQAKAIAIAAMGPDVLPPKVPRLRWSALPFLWRRPSTRPFRIWHARRNVEMLAGVVMRDLLFMPLRLVFTSAAQRRHTAWTRFLIARMDRVIATSARSAAYLTVVNRVILHGIDVERFATAATPTGQMADALAGRKLIGCSGRIRHQKGTDLFVEAMIALLPDHPDWSAVMTGRTTSENRSFESMLHQRIEAAGLSDRIRFAGEVEDIAPWFHRFDLYVAPPRNEGFGLTPLEAMASGTPVVASDAGAFREMIVDGETGRVVPTDDAAALAKAIAPYLEDADLRARHGAAARQRVREKFALEREADEIGAVYDDLWSGPDASRPARSAAAASVNSASTTSVLR